MQVLKFNPEKLTHLREHRGMSMSSLAELARVSKASVSMWERGETVPSYENIQLLASALGVDLKSICS